MKKINLLILTVAAAVLFAACGGTADNKGTNTVTEKPKAAPPTKEALVALETKAYEAWKNHDTKFFETFLNDKFVSLGSNGRMDRAAELKSIADHKCEIKTIALEDTNMRIISPDVAVLTSHTKIDGTCDGKKINDARAATVFSRKGDAWTVSYHSGTDIVEPKAPAGSEDKKADAKKDDAKKEDSMKKADDSKLAVAEPIQEEKGEDKKADAKKDVAKKDDAKKEDAKSDDKMAASKDGDKKDADAKPAADPLTEALLTIEKEGWNAWMTNDMKKMEEITTKDLTIVNGMGGTTTDQASTIKGWTEGKCEVKSFDLADAESISLTIDTALLTYKGSPVGTCGGQKLTPVWGVTVFVKDGAAWKASFIAERPA